MFILPFVLLLMIWIWPEVWFRLVKTKVEVVSVTPQKRQVNQGEPIPVTIHIRNRGWLPCPFIRVMVELPHGLSAHETHTEPMMWTTTYLFLRQEVKLNLTCYGMERGVQPLREVTLQMNDGLGIKDIFLHFDVVEDIAVLPAYGPAGQMKVPIQNFLGRYEVVRWLHPDEALLRGIRTYERGDAFKHMAWAASARSGKWMTKQFSSSSETTVQLVLNAQFFEPHWSGTKTKEFDALCELITTWSGWLQSKGVRLQFAGNCTISRDPRRQDHGEQRAEGIRSLLSRAFPYANGPFEQVLKFLTDQPATASPIIIFSSYFSPVQVKQLARLAQIRREITIVAGPQAEGFDRLGNIATVVSSPQYREECVVSE